MTTSYENTEKKHFRDKWRLAQRTVSSNASPGEHIWEEIKDFASAIIGLGLYIFLLRKVNWILIMIVTATSIISFFIQKYFSDKRWSYREQGVHYYSQREYFYQQGRDLSMAKDIRL